MSGAPVASSPGRSLRLLAFALLTSPVVMLVAVLVVLPPDQGELALPVAAGVLAAVLVGFVVAQRLGYRASPLPAGLDVDEARRRSVQAYQVSLLLRFVATEVPLVLALALAFVLQEGPWPYMVAVVAGLPSMAFHVLPRARSIERVQAALEAGGVRSYLPEALTP
jgi:hypothetical protein